MHKLPLDIVLKPRTEQDEPFLYELFKEIRSPEFLLLQLPTQALDDLLKMQFRAQHLSYQAQYPHAQDYLVYREDRPIGRLLVDRSPQALHLVDIALLAAARRHGVGTTLLQQLLAEAAAKSLAVRLHVRPSNPAAALYRRLGFVVSGGDGTNLLMEAPTAASAAYPEVADQVLAPNPPLTGPIQPELSSRYFRQLTGETLQAVSRGREAVSLTLEAVEPLQQHPGVPRQPDPNDSFVLRLSGPLQPELPSSMVELSHRNVSPIPVFLVPVARTGDRMEYEAIFNRALPS